MIEWSEPQRAIRESIRRFIEAEIAPNLEALERGDLLPYGVLRKMFAAFGIDEMNRQRFRRQIERERVLERGEKVEGTNEGVGFFGPLQLIPGIELSRYSPGLVTVLVVSVGVTAGAILAKGTLGQKERWAEGLLTLETIGAWALTEPEAGCDAFGSMESTARRDGDGYVLNGRKTIITNAPHADVIVFVCKLDEPGVEPSERKVLSFVLEKGMPGLTQSQPIRKMGLHCSPTGDLMLEEVRVGREHLLGETEESPARAGARETFSVERAGLVAMALGIIERCVEMAVEHARKRKQFGRPIGEFQLIQEKLARMEIARLNVQSLLFRTIESMAEGRGLDLAEASAMKLYSARAAVEVANDALQVFGGRGYLAEFGVEQLARDARVLQLYGGTDEILIGAIARDLLASR